MLRSTAHRRNAVVASAAASAGDVGEGPTTLERIAETLTIMFPIWVRRVCF